MHNTRFSYLYRDACNYKQFADVVLAGELTIESLAPFLKDKTFFIPSEVGLSDLQLEPMTMDDHIWHEIERVEATDAETTVDMTAEELRERFEAAAAKGWNEFDVIQRKQMSEWAI